MQVNSLKLNFIFYYFYNIFILLFCEKWSFPFSFSYLNFNNHSIIYKFYLLIEKLDYYSIYKILNQKISFDWMIFKQIFQEKSFAFLMSLILIWLEIYNSILKEL